MLKSNKKINSTHQPRWFQHSCRTSEKCNSICMEDYWLKENALVQSEVKANMSKNVEGRVAVRQLARKMVHDRLRLKVLSKEFPRSSFVDVSYTVNPQKMDLVICGIINKK